MLRSSPCVCQRSRRISTKAVVLNVRCDHASTSSAKGWRNPRMGTLLCAVLLSMLYCQPLTAFSCKSAEGIVRGTVTYQERMALPQSAQLHVALFEVQEEQETVLIAERTIATEGRQVPINFELCYRRASIQSTHRYVVEANIVMFGDVWFVTRRPVPVLTAGSPQEIVIVLSRSS